MSRETKLDTVVAWLELLRKAIKLDTPLNDVMTECKVLWGRLGENQQQVIDQEMTIIQQKLVGKSSEEQESILQAEFAKNSEGYALLKHILLDIVFRRQIEAKITQLLAPKQSAMMKLFLHTLAKKLGCQGDAKAVARALTDSPMDDASGIQNRLEVFSSTVEQCIDDQEDEEVAPTSRWGQKVWHVFCTLLLLAVDLDQVRQRLAEHTDSELPSCIDIIDNYSFTLAAVNGRYNQSFLILPTTHDTVLQDNKTGRMHNNLSLIHI